MNQNEPKWIHVNHNNLAINANHNNLAARKANIWLHAHYYR